MQSVRGKHISDRKKKIGNGKLVILFESFDGRPHTKRKLFKINWFEIFVEILLVIPPSCQFLSEVSVLSAQPSLHWPNILNIDNSHIVPKWLQIITSAFLNLSLTSLISSSRSSSLFPFSSPAKLGFPFFAILKLLQGNWLTLIRKTFHGLVHPSQLGLQHGNLKIFKLLQRNNRCCVNALHCWPDGAGCWQ